MYRSSLNILSLQEAAAALQRAEEENSRRLAEQNAEELRRQQQQQPVTDVSLSLPMISPSSVSGDRRSATVTPRVAKDAIRRVVLVRAANQGKALNPGEDVGVGISFQAARSTNHIVVVSIAPGSSAEASGQVFVGDIIHRINNVSVQGKRIPAVVSMIKGQPGTNVVMELQSSDALPPTVNSSNLYSSYTAPPSSYNGSQAPTSVEPVPGARMVSLVRQPLGPNSTTIGSDENVGVGLGFVITDGAHIVSALAPNGSAEQSGQIQIGDTILSVDGIPAAGKDVDTLVGLIKGRRGTQVRLLIMPGNNTVGASGNQNAVPSTQSREPTVATLARQPGPPPRLGSGPSSATPVQSSPPSARGPGNLSSRAATNPTEPNVNGEPTYSLRMTVRNATGLLGVEPGKIPVAVCHVRLLYPDAAPVDFESIPPVMPSLDPTYGNRVMEIPIPSSRLRNVQLELTLWDDHSKDQGFMGEVVINVGKLAEPGVTLGRIIEHSFLFKAGGTFVPKRQISGSIVLELLLRPPTG